MGTGGESFHPNPRIMTYATQEHCLINDSQVISFEELTDTTHGRIVVTKWTVTLINGHQHRKMTASYRYTRGLARQLWAQLKSQGAKPFSWA